MGMVEAVDFRIKGEEPKKKIVEVCLKRTKMGISLMAEGWHIVTLSSGGNLILHGCIDHSLGFQLNSEGEILVIGGPEA